MAKHTQKTFPFQEVIIATAAFVGGVCAGLLLAPRSGRETLRYLGEQGQELERKVREAGEQMAEQLQENVEQIITQVIPPVETNDEAHLREEDLDDALRIPKK